MNNNPAKPLLTFLMFLAGLFYIGAIVAAGIISITGGSIINEVFVSAITIIGGILATNLGAVIGISVALPAGPNASNAAKKYLGLRPTTTATRSRNMMATQTTTTTPNQRFQILACYFYVGALLVAAVFWLIAESSGNKNPVVVLPELTKTLLGVVAGALTVSLIK